MSSQDDGLGADAPLVYELFVLASISVICLGYTFWHCYLKKARLFSLFYLMLTSNFALFSLSSYGFACMYMGLTSVDIYDMAFPIEQVVYYIFLHVRSQTLMSVRSSRYVLICSALCNLVNLALGLVACLNTSLNSDPDSFVNTDEYYAVYNFLTVASLVLMCALDLFYFYLFFSMKRHASKMINLPVTMQIVVNYSFLTSINTIVYYIVTVIQAYSTSSVNIAMTFIININQFLFCFLQLRMKLEIDKNVKTKAPSSYSQPVSSSKGTGNQPSKLDSVKSVKLDT